MGTVNTEEAAATGAMVQEHRACVECGYDLFGLPLAGSCPECGKPVADSLRGILLQYASREYVGMVRQGHSIVLNGILAQVIITILVWIETATNVFGPIVEAGAGIATIAVSIVVFAGYLRLTIPDPQFTGTERPDAARQIVRIAVIGQIVFTLAQLVISVLSPGLGASLIINVLLGLLGAVMWAVQFFAMMRYTRWLGQRVPDVHVVKTATRYMWVLPLLTTFGLLLFGLGPLLALVMYWNLLDRMRKHLKAILATGEPARLKGMAVP